MTTVSTPGLPAGRAHHPSIDGLRGIAIALVLFNHSTQLFEAPASSGRLLWRSAPGAWIGVDLFFVVSGFLITSILIASRGRPSAFRVFWARRALRIFPLAYVYLGVVAALAATDRIPQLEGPTALGWVASYTLNFYIAQHGWAVPAISILWSLAVEEQFYTLWPLIALRVGDLTLARLLVFVLLVTPLLRASTTLGLGTVAAYTLTFCRWDALSCGALLALLWNSRYRSVTIMFAQKLLLPSALLVLVVLLVPFGPAHARSPFSFEVFGYSALALAFSVWTVHALEPGPRLSWFLNLAPLRHLGKLCYGLYIWHVLCAIAVRALESQMNIRLGFELSVAVWLALLLAIATLSYRLLELPLLSLKDRVAPAR